MKRNKIAALVIFNLLVAADGVASAKLCSSKNDTTNESQRYTSICTVLKHKDLYIGKQVRFNATLETDYSSYGHFEDKPPLDGECAGGGVISIASISNMHDSSVRKFIKSNRDYCLEHKMTLCVISVDVDFEEKLLMDDGGPYLFMTKIFSYSYDSEK